MKLSPRCLRGRADVPPELRPFLRAGAAARGEFRPRAPAPAARNAEASEVEAAGKADTAGTGAIAGKAEGEGKAEAGRKVDADIAIQLRRLRTGESRPGLRKLARFYRSRVARSPDNCAAKLGSPRPDTRGQASRPSQTPEPMHRCGYLKPLERIQSGLAIANEPSPCTTSNGFATTPPPSTRPRAARAAGRIGQADRARREAARRDPEGRSRRRRGATRPPRRSARRRRTRTRRRRRR